MHVNDIGAAGFHGLAAAADEIWRRRKKRYDYIEME